MGGANSVERLQQFNTELAKVIVTGGPHTINEVRRISKDFASIESSEQKQNFEPKFFLQKFVDPVTSLGLLHFVCFGDFIKDATGAANRDKLLKELIDDRVFDDINIKDPASGRNALHFACDRPLPHPANKFNDNNTDIVQTLLVEGVNFNEQDKNGLTPLMLAASSVFPGSIKELVGRGASVSPVDKSGKNVFHHFVLALGSREYHTAIPEDGAVAILETLTAMASAADKDAAAPNLPKHGEFDHKAIREHYKKQETEMVGERAVRAQPPPARDGLEQFALSPLLLAVREFRAETRYEMTLVRTAIVTFFLKNGFGFYSPPGAFYMAFKDFVRTGSPSASIGDLLVYDYKTEMLLSAAQNFVPQIFVDDDERDSIARGNPLVASIVLCHYGIFAFLLEEGGFRTLLNPIGSRQLTPLHILMGIRMDIEIQNKFVDRCVQFAFAVADKEKYFESNPKWDLGALFAVDAKQPDAKFSILQTREDLKVLDDSLNSYSTAGCIVLPAVDSYKLTPLVTTISNLRLRTLTNIIPHCAQLQSTFFESASRKSVQRVFIGESAPAGSLKRLLAKDGIFPSTTQLQLQGPNNTTKAEMEWIAGDESVTFTSIEFVDCAVDLRQIANSKKLNESLERLVLIRCDKVETSGLNELSTAKWAKQLKIFIEGGGDKAREAAEAVTGLGIQWFPDVTAM